MTKKRRMTGTEIIDQGRRLLAGYEAIGLDNIDALELVGAVVAAWVRRQSPEVSDAKSLQLIAEIARVWLEQIPRGVRAG